MNFIFNSAARPRARDCRCVCGSLVARVVEDGVELKCRRCKRTLLVAIPEGALSKRGVRLRVESGGD